MDVESEFSFSLFLTHTKGAIMLEKKDSMSKNFTMTMYDMPPEAALCEQCQAMNDYYRTLNGLQAQLYVRKEQVEQRD